MTHVAVVDRSPGRAWGPRRPRWASWTLCGGKRKIWSVMLPARPPTLERMADMGGRVSENHSEVRKHLIKTVQFVLWPRLSPSQPQMTVLLKPSRGGVCGRPSGLDTTSDIARVFTASLKVGRVSPRSEGAHEASTCGFYSCCMNVTLRSFTHSWKEERQSTRIASEVPVPKGLI